MRFARVPLETGCLDTTLVVLISWELILLCIFEIWISLLLSLLRLEFALCRVSFGFLGAHPTQQNKHKKCDLHRIPFLLYVNQLMTESTEWEHSLNELLTKFLLCQIMDSLSQVKTPGKISPLAPFWVETTGLRVGSRQWEAVPLLPCFSNYGTR